MQDRIIVLLQQNGKSQETESKDLVEKEDLNIGQMLIKPSKFL